MTHPHIDKGALRLAGQNARRALGPELRSTYSETACQHLLALLAKIQPRCLLTYCALPSEVDTTTLRHQANAELYAPVTDHHDQMEWRQIHPHTQWRTGVFGVKEPEEGALWSSECGHTILVCPLVAFDHYGNRLGMGKGCFDYWLASYHQSIDLVIGLAFSCQQVTAIPAEKHDMPMDFIITEKEVIQCLKR
ncbi:MAG: 5-formyltetrahydrofolate cyclo-ligase [Mariprofundus sp.]